VREEASLTLNNKFLDLGLDIEYRLSVKKCGDNEN